MCMMNEEIIPGKKKMVQRCPLQTVTVSGPLHGLRAEYAE